MIRISELKAEPAKLMTLRSRRPSEVQRKREMRSSSSRLVEMALFLRVSSQAIVARNVTVKARKTCKSLTGRPLCIC